MNLVRGNRFNDVSMLQNPLNRLFDSALQGWPGDSNGTTSWAPAADIYESDEDLIVNLDIPGIDPKMVDIRVENNVLTVRGERQFDQKQNSENYHRVERSYGTFGRSFTLSTSINAEKIRATYESGVLTIVMPKAETAKPRKIQITYPATTAASA
jgi:HSP20 family protein